MDLEDPLSLELELLEASYADELKISRTMDSSAIIWSAYPHVPKPSTPILVSVVLSIKIPKEYPVRPASFELSNPRGLDDSQLSQLLNELNSDANNAAQTKDIHIATSLATAAEYLTNVNVPNPCPVCMEKIDINLSDDFAFVCLNPCLHCVHRNCFQQYHRIMLEKYQTRVSELKKIWGSQRAEEMAERERALCPVCRTKYEDPHPQILGNPVNKK